LREPPVQPQPWALRFALLLPQNQAIRLPLVRQGLSEQNLSPRQEQKLEPPPVRARGHLGPDRRAGGGYARTARKCPTLLADGAAVPPPVVFQMPARRRNARWARAAVPPESDAERNSPLRRRSRNPPQTPVPRQNMLAAEEEERADRRLRRVFFCGAANAHASICACKAFNTEESAGSIRDGSGEPCPTATKSVLR